MIPIWLVRSSCRGQLDWCLQTEVLLRLGGLGWTGGSRTTLAESACVCSMWSLILQ